MVQVKKSGDGEDMDEGEEEDEGGAWKFAFTEPNLHDHPAYGTGYFELIQKKKAALNLFKLNEEKFDDAILESLALTGMNKGYRCAKCRGDDVVSFGTKKEFAKHMSTVHGQENVSPPPAWNLSDVFAGSQGGCRKSQQRIR